MSKPFYYSALDKTDQALAYDPLQEVAVGECVAFAGDIFNWDEFKHRFNGCDLLYTEMPWPAGYEKFYSQADMSPPDGYDALINIMNKIQRENASKAVIYVVGRSFADKFDFPNHSQEVMLHGYPALALMYRANITGLDFSTNYKLIESLADKYYSVGDFMAGFGNTGKIFAEKGGKFILSELNPRCIGYIKTQIYDWLNPKAEPK